MNQKILIGIGVFLVLIVLVQSVFLYRMSDQVAQLSNESTQEKELSISDVTSSLLSPDHPTLPFNNPDWNPFKEMQRMQNEMNKIFGDMRSQLHQSPGFDNSTKSFSFSPSVDIKEEKDQIIVTADIPGSDESNINVTVKDDQLTISATTRKSKENKNGSNLFRSERFIGRRGIHGCPHPSPCWLKK